MQNAAPPKIFSSIRRSALQSRMQHLQTQVGAARYLAEEAASDLLERLNFLRHTPKKALIIGDLSGILAAGVSAMGADVMAYSTPQFNVETPWPIAGFDFIACLFSLDTANDLPGALIHLRKALSQGGLAIVVFIGAGSLPVLREAMRIADGDRPAPRLHPQIDVRAGGQLLQRSGFLSPVVDTFSLTVRFNSLSSLLNDLRAQGLSNVLSDPGPNLTKTKLVQAQSAFADHADDDGRVTETFELLTLSGWQSAALSI